MLDSGPSGFKLKNFNAKIKLMEGNKIFKPNRLPPFSNIYTRSFLRIFESSPFESLITLRILLIGFAIKRIKSSISGIYSLGPMHSFVTVFFIYGIQCFVEVDIFFCIVKHVNLLLTMH